MGVRSAEGIPVIDPAALLLVSVRVDFRRLRRWSYDTGLYPRRWRVDDAASAYHYLTQSFPELDVGALQLRYRLSTGGHLYFYARGTPARTEALLAARAGMATDAGFHLDDRLIFPVRVPPGPVQRFRCRIRPLQDVEGYGERLRKFDPYDAELVALAERAPPRAAVYQRWLAPQFAGTATLTTLGVISVEEAYLSLEIRPGEMKVERGPDVWVVGTLEITDPPRFAELLHGGIGDYTRNGFGMIVLQGQDESLLQTRPFTPDAEAVR